MSLTSNIKFIDQIPIGSILDELESCPPSVWDDLNEWVRPDLKQVYAEYQASSTKNVPELYARLTWANRAKSTPDSSSEQDRLHLRWQQKATGSDRLWWLDENWRAQIPAVTATGSAYFQKTLAMLDQYWHSKNKIMSRAFFSRLQPGNQLYPHVDGDWGDGKSVQNRYGLVLITTEDAKFTVDSVSINPDPGTLFWSNNKVLHSAINPSTAPHPRIFLYMDVVE
jgi:hypothetical protein